MYGQGAPTTGQAPAGPTAPPSAPFPNLPTDSLTPPDSCLVLPLSATVGRLLTHIMPLCPSPCLPSSPGPAPRRLHPMPISKVSPGAHVQGACSTPRTHLTSRPRLPPTQDSGLLPSPPASRAGLSSSAKQFILPSPGLDNSHGVKITILSLTANLTLHQHPPCHPSVSLKYEGQSHPSC